MATGSGRGAADPVALGPNRSGDEPLAASEYDSLIGPLIRMLREERSSSDIAAWLGDQVEHSMGLSRRRDKDVALAYALRGWWRMRDEEAH